MLSLPYGGITITGGADTLAVDTTAVKLASFSAAGGANSPASGNANDGDPAVIPDKANNRVKVNSPGIYYVDFTLTGVLGSAAIATARLRKNGTAYGNGMSASVQLLTTKSQLHFSGFVVVTAADNPKTLPTFADPSSSGFAGAGGAPKTLSYLEIYIECASSQTLTIESASLNVLRVG